MRIRPLAVAVLAFGVLVVLATTGSAAGPAPGSADRRAAVEVPSSASSPSGAAAPVPGEIVRGFEAPAHPYAPGHRGVALRADPGTVVRAALAGRVSFAGVVARTGWVSVDHGGGLVTSYGPLEPIMVNRHDAVGVGQVLGRLAREAPSLHWGARLDGVYIDPLLLLGAWEAFLVEPP